MAKNDGGAAFPTGGYSSAADGHYRMPGEQGMSLRDYFAAKAMQGLIVNPSTCNPVAPISARAYELADAMLAARND